MYLCEALIVRQHFSQRFMKQRAEHSRRTHGGELASPAWHHLEERGETNTRPILFCLHLHLPREPRCPRFEPKEPNKAGPTAATGATATVMGTLGAKAPPCACTTEIS